MYNKKKYKTTRDKGVVCFQNLREDTKKTSQNEQRTPLQFNLEVF